MKICIIGGVAGGATAAARLRRLDEEAQIIIFERGPHISFANCGLPYHISGKIQKRDCLLLQTPESFYSRFRIDVRTKNEVLSINRKEKTVEVKDLSTGNVYQESYDRLILSPGAYPFVPPMDGAENSKMLMKLRDIPDMDAIIEHIKKTDVKEAVVIGGGFIGIEMAENLVELGIRTHLVELADQVLMQFDPEMAHIIHAKLAEKGVVLHLSDKVERITGDTSGKVTLSSGKELNTDLIVSAVGVRPENKLAKEAELEIGKSGGIVVDDRMRTSDPDIFAVGDAVENTRFVDELPALIPLAGPANKQARVAADNICGIHSRYGKTLGTSILKVFNLQAASTGFNEKTAARNGIEYQAIHLHPSNHAGYYPGASPLTLKVLFDLPDGKIIGAQCIGNNGADKRIDVIATAIRAKMTVYDLQELELSYAPPFGSAKDPVNMAGFVGGNILQGLVRSVTWDKIDHSENPFFLDVRTRQEFSLGSLPGAVNIPVDELRDRVGELPKDRHIIINCQVGIRAYIAYRILAQSGFENLSNLSGGYKTYTHYTADIPAPVSANSGSGGCSAADSNVEEAQFPTDIEVMDLTGLQCPGPLMQLSRKMETLQTGERVVAKASDPGFLNDIPAFCRVSGNKLVSTQTKDDLYFALVEKAEKKDCPSQAVTGTGQKTMVVFSNDLDRAMASFVIANGAKSMGSDVTMFFTFWGLNILRKENAAPVKKSLLDRMFGMMMPKGVNKLKLSKMNMGGMGTMMMKHVMNKKNVDSLPLLVQQAQASGIKFVACAMSMDVMGIKKEELIDGVEIGGVAQYLSEADQSNVNLFI